MTTLAEYAPLIKGFRASLGAEDMQPIVYVEYEGDLVATVFVPAPKHVVLSVAAMLASGMDASAITVALDGRMHAGTAPVEGEQAEMPLNPVTGKPWEAGQMSALAEDGVDVSKYGVLDCVFVTRIERAEPDNVRSVTAPYRVAAGTVDFLPTEWDEDTVVERTEGYIPDALRHAMTVPTVASLVAASEDAQLAAAEDGLTPEEMVAHQRCGAAKALLGLGFPVMLAARNDTDKEVYQRSLVDDPDVFSL